MKNKLSFMVLLLASIMLTACSGIRVSQDYLPDAEFNHLKTYRWAPDLLAKEQQVENNNPLLNLRIHKAIDRKLAAMGYQLTDSDKADFRVSYQTQVQSRIESEGTTGSFAIGFGNTGRFGAIGIHTGNIITEKDEATLVIDIIDDNSGKLLWRGVSTRYAYTHNDPEKLTQIINKHVDAILSQFPPNKPSQ